MSRATTPATVTVALIIAIIPAGSAAALGFNVGLGDWSGTLGLSGNAGSQSTTSEGGDASAFSSRLLRESISVANRGFYAVDPLLFTGNMGLQLNFNQDNSRNAESAAANRGRVVGYFFDATFLAEMPYTANLFANRNQNQSVPSFGGRTDGVSEKSGATFSLREYSALIDWGLPWVSANFGLSREHTAETTTSFNRSFRRDETRGSVDFDAHKGFQTADLDFRYRLDDLRNRAFTTGTFRSHSANLNYSLDFGPTGNRRFDSTAYYLRRDGATQFTTFGATERLHIDHYRNLSTDYRYSLNRQDTSGGNTTAQNGSFSVSHDYYQTLATTAQASGSRINLASGSTSTFGGQLTQSYHHSLPGGGNVRTGWSGGYRRTANTLGVSKIDVADEPHNAPTPLGAGAGLVLGHGFVVTTGIVVVDTRGGARLPTTAGVDYAVTIEGNRTRIEPLAGSAVIQPGDPLAVSYTYQVDPSLTYQTKSLGFDAGVDYGWIAIIMRHQQSDNTLLSAGDSRFLVDSRTDNAQLDLRGAFKGVSALANASIENHRTKLVAYDRRGLGLQLTWRPWSNLNLTLNLNAIDTQYTLPLRESSLRSAHAALDWYSAGGWTNTAFADVRGYRESGLPTETVRKGGVRTRINYARLTFSTGAAFSEWVRGGTRSKDKQFDISIVRQF